MDVDSEPRYLNVRETAQRLRVHENTVRNWVRAGILPTARIPGSRFHRFDERDVERLLRQRGSVGPSVEQERRTIGPELVDAAQLNDWASLSRREAEHAFPELIRRLLAATPGVTNLSVRAGDGVTAPGWDGMAWSTGTSYLPAGSLCFEFGVGGKPRAKADEDWANRCIDPVGVATRDATFVFVTPRRWHGAANWASERRAEDVFRDVRVLDADDLEGWLQDTPAVHHWISERLGRRPRDAETLERWWSRSRGRTDPELPAALFLAGRERERDSLAGFLQGNPDVISVQAGWRDDALAFVAATVEWMLANTTGSGIIPLIVASASVWERLLAPGVPMTLLPIFDDPDITGALRLGHHVVLVAGRDRVVRGRVLRLDPPHREMAREILVASGIPFERAYRLSAMARRSMPALVRTLARDPRAIRPPWAEPAAARILAPLILAGAWTTAPSDVELVSRLADEEWPVIERELMRWRASDDPPFVRSGSQWDLASPEEALLVLRDQITTADFERWQPLVLEVLLERDPSLDLEPARRPMAGVLGIRRDYSSVLRRGMAEALALVGSASELILSNGETGADVAGWVVREILARANVDLSAATWRSLSDILPLLAEAAPDVFLDAVQDDLDRHEPLLAQMFMDAKEGSWLYSSSPHTGLLWALETLAWSPDYLIRAAHSLSRLQVVDPGGRLANRPLESLHTVLVGWIRHTSAPLQLKVKAVEQICRTAPDIGWQLILRLWPQYHSATSPPTAPRYHDWVPDDRGVAVAEWISYIGQLVGSALRLAERDPDRWATLAEHVASLPPGDRDRVLRALEAYADPESLDEHACLTIWERVHKEIARHRQFPDADWSLGEDVLVRLDLIAQRLEPKTSVARFAYLFDWHPDLPEVKRSDYDAYQKRLWELRADAIRETVAAGSVDGLKALAERSAVPSHVGWMAGVVTPEELSPHFLAWLDSDNQKLQQFALSWASSKLQPDRGGLEWLRHVFSRPEVSPPVRRIKLALSAPPTSALWDTLADVDADLADEYWHQMHAVHVQCQDTARATEELLARNRPWVAVDLLAADLHQPGTNDSRSMTPALAEKVLDAALNADPRQSGSQSLGYEVGILLDYLEASDAAIETLARLEFALFQLVEPYRAPRALYSALSDDPGIFVSLVSRVYRGQSEPPRQSDDREAGLAHQAYWVLSHWSDVPGRREDGTLDGDHLKRWVHQARLQFVDADRADIGDEQIGQVLSHSPFGADDIWPAESVRDLIETIGSVAMETGIHTGVMNARGVTSRGIFDGGQLERNEATRYWDLAKRTTAEWPRTSRVLRRLAEGYERDARREDAEAEARANTE